jgi:hypothetical protein
MGGVGGVGDASSGDSCRSWSEDWVSMTSPSCVPCP